MSHFSLLITKNSSSWVQEVLSWSPSPNIPYPSPVPTNDGVNKVNYLTMQMISLFAILLVFINIRKRKYFPGILGRKSVIDKIPGPPGLPLLGNLLDILTEKDFLRRLSELAEEFQPYYRLQLGPKPMIVLTSPDAVEKLLCSNQDGHIAKADEYKALADYFDGGLVNSEGEKWRSRRKLFSPLFNYKCFPHFLEVFNRHSKLLIHDLAALYENNEESKQIQNTIYESLLKIICETSMGVELNDTSDGFHKFFEEAERTKEYIWFKALRPWYQINWIWKLHPFRRVYEANMKYIKDYISQVIRHARAKLIEEQESPSDSVKNKTVMDAMFERGLSNSDIREEAHTIISAGHETSASAIQFTLMFLALHPEHQKKCQEEVDAVINDESKCPDGNFTMSSMSDLKHTERCIKEALRLYPIVYMTARKLQTPLEMGGNVVFPEGTTCVIFATDLHRNPKLFPNPEKFDPSHFTPENCAARHPYAYIPFSLGPRNCLGQKYSMVQMKLAISRILHHFTLSTTDQLDDVPLDTSIVLTPVRGYNFVLRKRNPIPEPEEC